MSQIEEFCRKYPLSDHDAHSLEPFLTEDEEVVVVSYATQQRLKELFHKINAEFLGIGLVSGRIIRIYAKDGSILFSKDLLHFGTDPGLTIFRDISTFCAKVKMGHSNPDTFN